MSELEHGNLHLQMMDLGSEDAGMSDTEIIERHGERLAAAWSARLNAAGFKTVGAAQFVVSREPSADANFREDGSIALEVEPGRPVRLSLWAHIAPILEIKTEPEPAPEPEPERAPDRRALVTDLVRGFGFDLGQVESFYADAHEVRFECLARADDGHEVRTTHVFRGVMK